LRIVERKARGARLFVDADGLPVQIRRVVFHDKSEGYFASGRCRPVEDRIVEPAILVQGDAGLEHGVRGTYTGIETGQIEIVEILPCTFW
jgi:hypothetical protein